MKKFFTYALLAGLVFLLLACAPRLDVSTDETAQASLEKVIKSLSDEKRQEFEGALMFISLSTLTEDKETREKKEKEFFHGKTANQIIAKAKQMDKNFASKSASITQSDGVNKKIKGLKAIKKLEFEIEKIEADKKAFEDFEVLAANFKIHKGSFGDDAVIFTLSVKNGTKTTISRAYFEASLVSDGRQTPWHQGEIFHTVKGGLEPGEEATWEVYKFSGWEYVKAPADASVKIKVLSLDGPDGEEVYAIDSLEKKLKELEELKAKQKFI